jgi:hypothetical protein
MGTLFAIGDLHINHPGNRGFVAALRPRTEDHWRGLRRILGRGGAGTS